MENQYIIKGGSPLKGEVVISGAKNAALGILAGAIMANEPVIIENLPDVRDINVMLEAIEDIGATVRRLGPHEVEINGGSITNFTVDQDAIRKIRASYYLLGALLGKYKKVSVTGESCFGDGNGSDVVYVYDNIELSVFRPTGKDASAEIVESVSQRY